MLNSDELLFNPLGLCNTILSKKMVKKRTNLYKNQIGTLTYLLDECIKNKVGWSPDKFSTVSKEKVRPPPPTPSNIKGKDKV